MNFYEEKKKKKQEGGKKKAIKSRNNVIIEISVHPIFSDNVDYLDQRKNIFCPRSVAHVA